MELDGFWFSARSGSHDAKIEHALAAHGWAQSMHRMLHLDDPPPQSSVTTQWLHRRP